MALKRAHPLSGAISAKRRKAGQKPVEEVMFDTAAREDFLTGFHKRKLARARHAQEIAAKKERKQRNETRRALREERQKDVERHTEAINKALATLEKRNAGKEAWSDSESAEGEWQGIAEPEPVDYEDEYLDEDRHTVVTVEAVDPSRQGLRSIADELDHMGQSSDEEADLENNDKTPPAKPSPAANEQPETKYPSKKKTSFRYESKAARKYKKSKERSGKGSKIMSKKARKP